MRIAIDTNRYTDFCRGIKDVVETFALATEIFMPLITLGELRAGFAYGNRANANERVLSVFLNSPRVVVLVPDEQTTFHYSRLYLQLKQQATPIPTNDLWIAALVVQHGLTLYTRDKHFDRLPNLPKV